MKHLSNAIAILIFLGLLLIFGWLSYFSVKYLIAQFGMVDQQTSAILIISSVSFLVGSLIIAGTLKTLNADDDKSIHPEKAAIYTRFADLLVADKQDIPKAIDELKKFMMIWASDPVLEAFTNYVELVENAETSQSKLKKQAQKVVTSIRQDIGDSDIKTATKQIEKLLAD